MTIAAHVFLQTLRRLRAAAPDEARHYQAVMLARLVDFAARMVPAYRMALHPLIAEDGVALDRFERVPVLTAAALAQLGETLVLAERPEALGALHDGRPAGTTGSSLAGPVDDDFLWADACVHELLFDDLQLDNRAALIDIVAADKAGEGTGEKVGEKVAPWSLQRPRAARVAIVDDFDAGVVAARLADAPEALAVRAEMAALHRLALADAALPAAVRCVIGHGVAAGPMLATIAAWAERRGVAAGFVLATTTTGALAATGADGVLRPADGVAFVEIVDHRGLPVAPGTVGRVVATPFYAFTRPLIRIDTGLLARRSDDGALVLA